MAPFTPNGNPQRRSLYGAGNESYPTRQSSHYNTTKSGDSAGGGSNSYSTGRGSYGGGGGKDIYTDGTAKYGVGDTGKNSYMTGVSNIAPEKPSPKGWSKVFKASFPKGGVMRSSAGSNTNGGTGNSYAERDTSSLYYTGGAAYQKGSRSASPSRPAPRQKSYADSIPRPASMSLPSVALEEPQGFAVGGFVGQQAPTPYGAGGSRSFGFQQPQQGTQPAAPKIPPPAFATGNPFDRAPQQPPPSIPAPSWSTGRSGSPYAASSPFLSGQMQPPSPQPQVMPGQREQRGEYDDGREHSGDWRGQADRFRGQMGDWRNQMGDWREQRPERPEDRNPDSMNQWRDSMSQWRDSRPQFGPFGRR